MKYFISYALKYKDSNMAPISYYGNTVIDLPHEIQEQSDINDLQTLIEKIHNMQFNCAILWFQKM